MTGMQNQWGGRNIGILLIQANNHGYTFYSLVLTTKMCHASKFSLNSDKKCN